MRFRGVKRLFRFPSRTREDVREDIQEEFQFHLDTRTVELVRSGMTEAAARQKALRELGNQASGAAECAVHGDRIERRRWIARLASEFRQDVGFGLRLIARGPGFSAVAILTLAVAIGANTAIFTVVNALVFKPLPVVAPQELMRVHSGESTMSWPNYEDIVRRNEVFIGVAAHRVFSTGLATGDTPLRVMGELTSANYLSLLGVPAAIGRTFTPADSRRDVVVLADHFWHARYAADPAIVGRVLTLAGRPHEVVGVMPRDFRGAVPTGLRPDFWLPVDTATPSRALRDRGLPQFEVIGRLRPGVGQKEAAAAMQVVARHMRAELPDLQERFLEVEVFPIQGLGAFQGMASLLLPIFAFLALMTIVSGFVLLIGCANIAGLLIGRAAARRREIAVRLALGAGRSRLVRQLLTESLLLAIIGGAAGVVLAIWLAGGVNEAVSRLPIPVEFDLEIDRLVLAYAFGLTTLTSLVFGLAPARRAARFDVVSSLKDESGGSTGHQRLRRALVVGQVAVCSALLVWSGLFLRSLGRISDVNPGFDASDVLLASVALERDLVEDQRGEQIFVELQQRVRESPGVHSAGMASVVPLALMGNERFSVSVDDDPAGGRRRVVANRLTPGWFETVRIPLVAGRDFTWDDRAGAPGVVIVNETLARQFWNGIALGKRLTYGRKSVEVVGIVRDSKYGTLGETIGPTVYQPFRQNYVYMMTLHVRAEDLKATTDVINREMRRLAPDVAVDIETMTEAVSAAVLPAQIGAAGTGVFGMVAMLLSTLGVYGLVSFSVLQRTREIGVRKAIGARTSDIVRLVVGGSAGLSAIGLAIGLGAGALGAVLIGGFIFGVSPMDPATLAGVAVLVMSAALAASAVPALHAARVDPVVTLRDV